MSTKSTTRALMDKPACPSVSDEYPPDLYEASGTAPSVRGFSAVGEAEIRQYAQEGFIVIEDAFGEGEVEAARSGILDLVEGKCPGFEGVQFEKWAEDRLDSLRGERRLDLVRKLMSFVNFEPRLRALAEDARLVALLERLLGAPPQLAQDMALLKPPHGREKPWHQDNAYFDYPLETPVVGVWIALDEVSAANGCMHLIPGGHRNGPITHFKRRDWQICDTQMVRQASVAVPLRPGGCLVFNGLLPHGTPRNGTNLRRRAVQYHYVPKGTEKVATEIRLVAFGSEGKNVSC